ncbi:MAG: hypothetical protein LBF13_01715, partial [Campylobacteraceae bacterium]|nr:hypothetical protein [Campylobacteraceae bacterium]
MAKILITSIGTEECLKDGIGKCQKTIYQIDGKRYENKVLLIDALTEHHQFDKIFFIGICKSVWDSIYTLWANDDCDELLKQRESTQG